MEEYFGVAEDEGLTVEELGSIQAIVMAVSAGRVGAQFAAARALARKRVRSGAPTEE